MKQRIRLTESQLNRVIRRCVNEALEDNVSPLTSYRKQWNDEGTVYDQTIKIGLTQEELLELSKKMQAMSDDWSQSNDTYLRDHSNYLQRGLKFGKNFLTLSQLKAISDIMNWNEYKRVHLDRNTCLLIVKL